MHDKVNALSGAAGKDDLALFARMDEVLHSAPCGVKGGSGGLRQVMHRAVDIGVLMRLVMLQALDDWCGHLAGGGVVQVHQGLFANL
jgi:hypothetical protein